VKESPIFRSGCRLFSSVEKYLSCCTSAINAEVSDEWGCYQPHRMSHDPVTLAVQRSRINCVTMTTQRVRHIHLYGQMSVLIVFTDKGKLPYLIHGKQKVIMLIFVNNINPFSNSRFSDCQAYSWTKHFPFRHL
jgi:hypothetical protein